MTAHAHPPTVAITLLLALAWNGSALAQTRLYLLTGGDVEEQCSASNCNPGRLIQIDVDRREITSSTPIRHARSRGIGPRVTPDGRFLLWSGSEQADYRPLRQPLLVSLFDITGRQQTTPFAATGTLDIAPFSVHPSEMRAFLELSLGGPITVAEPGQTTTIPSPLCHLPFFEARSGDGGRLSFWCTDRLSTVVVDSTDGRVISSISNSAAIQALDDAGSEVFTVEWDWESVTEPTMYRRFDVATGAKLAERKGTYDEFTPTLWGFDRRTRHLYAGRGPHIAVLDAATLADVGRIESPHPAMYPSMTLDRDLPHAYIAWSGAIDGRPVLRVSVVHTETLATMGSLDVSIDSHLIGIALGPRPPRLSDLSVKLDGNLATLTWTIAASRSIATEQLVEVGFAPGQTVARLAVAAGATSLTVPGAPPGRYYVRVRSENGTGLGAPSNEVLVDVP